MLIKTGKKTGWKEGGEDEGVNDASGSHFTACANKDVRQWDIQTYRKKFMLLN